jgi:hypothetical protein
VAAPPNDLSCFFSLQEKTFSWHITDTNTRFKLVIPFSAITLLEFVIVSPSSSPQENGNKASEEGVLTISINQTPSFFIEANIQGRRIWSPCKDFSEQKQASSATKHVLRGRPGVMRSQVLSLVHSDAQLQKVSKMDHAGFEQLGTTPSQPNASFAPALSETPLLSFPTSLNRHSTSTKSENAIPYNFARRGSMPVISSRTPVQPNITSLSLDFGTPSSFPLAFSNMNHDPTQLLNSSSIHSFLENGLGASTSASTPSTNAQTLATGLPLQDKSKAPNSDSQNADIFDQAFLDLIQMDSNTQEFNNLFNQTPNMPQF